MATSIDFPSSPSVGQEYTYGSVTYIWDGLKWSLLGDIDNTPTDDATTVPISSNWAHDHAVGETVNLHTKLGTVSSGIWQGTAVDQTYISDGAINPSKLDIEFTSIVAMSALDVDWSTGQVFTKTLTGNSTLTFSNLHIGVKDLEITGNFTLGFPTWLNIISGEYDGSVLNFIQVVCTKDTTTEIGWCTIGQEL